MAESNKAGVWALILSFLIPIVGIVFFFVYQKEVENYKAYLYCAITGIVVGIIAGIL